jgi:hypothetical protein
MLRTIDMRIIQLQASAASAAAVAESARATARAAALSASARGLASSLSITHVPAEAVAPTLAANAAVSPPAQQESAKSKEAAAAEVATRVAMAPATADSAAGAEAGVAVVGQLAAMPSAQAACSTAARPAATGVDTTNPFLSGLANSLHEEPVAGSPAVEEGCDAAAHACIAEAPDVSAPRSASMAAAPTALGAAPVVGHRTTASDDGAGESDKPSRRKLGAVKRTSDQRAKAAGSDKACAEAKQPRCVACPVM